MKPQHKKYTAISVLLIIVLGSLVYANSLRNPFIWDDTLLITENDYIKDWSSAGKLFRENMGASAGYNYSFYRPLQMLSYAADYTFWKLKPQGFHLTNILLHILAGLCLYWLLRIIFKDAILASLTGLFFVVHPVHTEAITYISGRSDPLALVFILLTFILYVLQLKRPRPLFYCAMAFTYIAALLSREQSLVLILLLLLYHYVSKEKIKPRLIFPLVILASIYCVLRFTLLQHLIANVSFKSSALDRLPGFFAAIASYLRLLILPFDLHMEYGWKLFSLVNPRVILGILFFIAGVIYAQKVRARRPVVCFALAWFFLTLLPVSNIYPINAYMAEHWLYMPSIGFFLLLAYAILFISQKRGMRVLSVTFTAALLGYFSFLTIAQNLRWKDPITFYQRTLGFAPQSSKAMNNLANAYQAVGKYEEAVPLYKKTIEIDPSFKSAYFNLANAYKKLGRYEEAIPLYRKAIEEMPDSPFAYYNLGNAYKELRQYDQAIPLYKDAIARKANFIDAYNNIGIAYSASGQRQEAISSFKKAIEIDPANGVSYANLAVEYYNAQNYDLAIRYCDQAIELGAKPNPEFMRLLGEYMKRP